MENVNASPDGLPFSMFAILFAILSGIERCDTI